MVLVEGIHLGACGRFQIYEKEDMDGSRQMIFCNEYDRPASSFIDGEKDKTRT